MSYMLCYNCTHKKNKCSEFPCSKCYEGGNFENELEDKNKSLQKKLKESIDININLKEKSDWFYERTMELKSDNMKLTEELNDIKKVSLAIVIDR